MSDFVRRFGEAARAEAAATPSPETGLQHPWGRDTWMAILDRYSVRLAQKAADTPPHDWSGRDAASLLAGFDRQPASVTDAVYAFLDSEADRDGWPVEWGRDSSSVAMRYSLVRAMAGGLLPPHLNGNGSNGNGHHTEEG